MVFDPGLKIGQILKNADIVDTFKCGNMGGMRRSKTTNTLVIVSDYTKGLYYDKWIGGVLHYTGMGKSGDQDLYRAQNATLAECGFNGVDVHLFEVMDPGEYVYCGRIELVDSPYEDTQPGEDGIPRKVWIFPVRPVPDNDVQKPQMFVFKDMDDYIARGKNVDEEYIKMMQKRKKCKTKTQVATASDYVNSESNTSFVIPTNILGKTVKHKTFGIGKIIEIDNLTIVIQFETVGKKTMVYSFCMQNNLLEFI